MKIYAKVEGQHYEFERPETDSRGFIIGSSAKYCPLCLAGWAHMTAVIDEPGECPDEGCPHYGTPHSHVRMKGNHCVVGQICARCGRVEQQLGKLILKCIPGSLLEEPQTNCQTLDWDLLDYLPRELQLREFNLHYEFLIIHSNSRNDSTHDSHDQPATPSNVGEVGL